MDFNTFTNVAPALFKAGHSVEIVGAPGIGKSSLIRQIAASLSYDEPFGLVTYILSQMDPIDMRGFIFPQEQQAGGMLAKTTQPTVWPAPHNVTVFHKGEMVVDSGTPVKQGYEAAVPAKGILFFDEFGQSEQDMQKSAAQILLDKRMGEFKLESGWSVWAASNRSNDRSGVTKRLAFLRNRMMQVELESGFPAFQAFANKAGVHPLTITFAKKYPAHVFPDAVPQSDGPFCTPRSLVLLSETLEALRKPGDSEARLPDSGPAMELAKGWIGEAAAVDFMTHIRLGNELPEVEDVAKSPNTTEIPTRPDAQFIMANMLAHHITDKNGEAFLTYMKRLGVEMQVLFVESAVYRHPMIMKSAMFREWSADNRDLQLAAISA